MLELTHLTPTLQIVEELGGHLSEAAVLKRLRKLNLVRGGKSSKRKSSRGSKSKVPVEQLRDLYEQFKDKVSQGCVCCLFFHTVSFLLVWLCIIACYNSTCLPPLLQADMLNHIAAHLPGSFSAQQVCLALSFTSGTGASPGTSVVCP